MEPTVVFVLLSVEFMQAHASLYGQEEYQCLTNAIGISEITVVQSIVVQIQALVTRTWRQAFSVLAKTWRVNKISIKNLLNLCFGVDI